MTGCLSFSALAQSKPGRISGFVSDEGQKPVEFATVALIAVTTDSTFIKATYTDATGAFVFESLTEGRYLTKVTFMGYHNGVSSVLTLTTEQPIADAGTIRLQPQAKQLAEVVVTGQKAIIEQRIDRMVLNVDALPSNAGASALDILEKSPGVTVNLNNNTISLKGKKEVVIMLDDKLTYLSGEELVTLLRSMNASQLSQVEIMTNPSAKYDAAGNAGIINIRTKKQTAPGFNGTLTLGVGYSSDLKSNDGLSLNYRSGKLNTFFNYGFIHNYGYSIIEAQRNFMGINCLKTGELNQSANIIYRNQSHNLRMGMDYSVSQRTKVGISLSGFLNPQRPSIETRTHLTDATGNIDLTLFTPSSNKTLWRNGSLNINAHHTFDDKGREISASADLLNYNASNSQYLVINTYSSADVLLTKVPQRGDIPLDITIFTAKLDYSQPLGQYKLETGLKTAISTTNNQANYFRTTNGVESPDYDLSNHFNYQESIYAGYGNLSRQVGKWYGQVGLRYEDTQYTGHQLGNPAKPDSVFVRHYRTLFPTLFVSYKANDQNQFVLSTGRRIDRPAYRDLNPLLSIIDRYTFMTGNPFLQPQFTNNIELSHTYKNFLTTTLNYSRTDGFINETLEKKGDVIIRSVGNIAIRDNIGLAVSLQLPITKAWSANLFVNGAYTAYEGTIAGFPFLASAFSVNLNVLNQFTLRNGWAVEVSGFYNGRNRDEGQAIIRSMSQLSLGLSKQLWNKRASLVLNVRDVFHTQLIREIQNFQNVISTVNIERDTRVVNIAFTYRFGQAIKGSSSKAKTSAEDETQRVKL